MLNLRYNGLQREEGGKVGGRSVKAAPIPTEPSSIQRELTPAAFVTRLCLALSETVTGILSGGGGAPGINGMNCNYT